MDNHEYWRQRAINYERDWYKRCEETVEKRLARHYMKALTEIKGDILQLYAMLAKENGLDFNEARRILRGREFKEWRFAMSDYLKTHDGGLTKDISALALRSNITRLEKLHSETLRELDRMGRNVNDDMKKFLSGAYKETYARDVYDMVKTGKLSVPLTKVDSPNVERVLAARWSGKNYSERIWKNTHLLSRAVRETIATGVHRGLSIEQLSRRLEAKMHAGYSNAERLVQTEMNFVNNQARADSMEAAGIMWYEFIAVLDNRTSAPCRSRDGESYPLEEKSVGFNFPPLHPRCRSTVAPYIEELGRRGKRRVKVNGEMVRIPASMTYKDYKAVYIDKKITLDQWQKSLSKTSKNGIITLNKLTLKEEIEPLRQKLLQQKASGTSAAEMEVTVKEAGKIIVREVKGLKIYDVPAGEKIDEAFLDSLYKIYDDMDYRIAMMSLRDPLRKDFIDIRAKMENDFFEYIQRHLKPEQEYKIFKKRSEQIANIISSIRDLATSEQAERQFKTRSTIKPMMSEALLHYPAEWVETSINKGNVRLRITGRGYYDDDKKRIGAGAISLDTGIHELGHRMEDVLDNLKEMERAFYKRRTKGEKLQKLRDLCPDQGYEKKELARKDKFLDPYIGKTYRGQNYELVSMGFEYAYTNPELLLQDEDMAQWIYGLLAIF